MEGLGTTLSSEPELSSIRLERVRNGSRRFRIALMCAEKDPLTCHRAILVGRYLRTFGFVIAHILENGELESNVEMEQRLLKAVRMQGSNLFHTEAQTIEQAYDTQAERIAYVKNGKI